jgi:hypothetical protein
MSPATYEGVREKRLLIACARTRMTPAVSEQVRNLAAGPIDWNFLLQTAAENSVLPLLALHLPRFADEAFSSEQFAKLKGAARAAGIRALQLSAELIRVVEALRAKSVLAMPYKGPVLAAQAYGDLALREFEDLDIIVPQRDMERANEVLVGLGYRAKFPWIFDAPALVPGEYNYYDPSRRVMVELHTERTLRHFPVVPDLDEMSKSATPVALGGHEVPTFCAEDTLVLLCIHGSKDFWERILWVADVSEFVQRETRLDWDRVLRRAEQLKAQRMVFLGLALAVRLLDAPLPGEIRTLVEHDSIATALAVQIAEQLVAKDARVWGAGQSFQYRRQMVLGAFDSWRYGLRLAMVPAEEDWMMVRLPRALAPFYVVLRPLRLFRKYGAGQKKT